MNCQDCRKHLHPYLDSELEVTQNLNILQHLNACTECARVFEVEEAAWEHARGVLSDDGASDSFRATVPNLLAAADRRDTWQRTLGYVVPLAVAASFIIFMQVTSDSNTAGERRGTTPVRHVHDHGAGVEFVVGHFLDLHGTSKEPASKILSKEFLQSHGNFTELDAEEARETYKQLMGPGAKIPSALRGKGIRGALADSRFAGTDMQSLLLSNHREQVFGVYVLNRNAAKLLDMHDLGSEGMREDYRLERCKSCNVITVTQGESVFVFVTHNLGSVDPAIELARETF